MLKRDSEANKDLPVMMRVVSIQTDANYVRVRSNRTQPELSVFARCS